MTTKTNNAANNGSEEAMSYTKNQILGMLKNCREGEWMYGKEMARLMGRATSTVSRALVALEDAGLIMDMGRYELGHAWSLILKARGE